MAKQTGELVNVRYAYAAVTTDVINEYCFSKIYDAVLTPDLNTEFYESVTALTKMVHVVSRYFELNDWDMADGVSSSSSRCRGPLTSSICCRCVTSKAARNRAC